MRMKEFLLNFLRLSMGGGGGGPQSTTTVQQNYSPEEAARRTQVMDEAQRIYTQQQPLWSSMMNPAARPVGPSAETTQAQNLISSAATGPGQQMGAQAANALNFGLSGQALDPNSAPGYQGALKAALRPVDNAFTDPGGVLSKIRGNFTAGNSGGRGTRESIAEGIAGREYLNTVGDVSSNMALQQYGQGLDFMKSSMAFAPNMYNLLMQPGISLGAVGAQKEAFAQQGEDVLASDRAWQLQAPWAGLQPYASMVTGMSNPMTTSNTSGAVARGNPAMGALGGAAMGMSIGGPWGAAAGALIGLLGSQ